ncbi:futalosine hydrolase [Desulfoplanes sp.]
MLALVFATARESRATLGPSHVGIKEGTWAEVTLRGRTCLQVLTGIGLVNAALVLGKLLASYPRLEGVLNLGIGGSFDPHDLPLGGWATANQEIWPEIGVKNKGCVHAQALGFPIAHADNEVVWDRVSIDPQHNIQTMGLALPRSMHQAPFITVAGVTSTQERALFLQTIYRGGVENMEGFPLALGCMTHGIPFAEIRTISNIVGPKTDDTWRIDKAFKRLGDVLPALFSAA